MQERLGGRLAWVEVEDQYLAGGSRERERVVDVGWAAHEDQPARTAPDAGGSVEDYMNSGALDEGDLAQVEHHQTGGELCIVQRLAELGRGREIQLARHMNPGRARTALFPSAAEPRRHRAQARCW
jgi:hypothetical protein